jgi:hypothetical protein
MAAKKTGAISDEDRKYIIDHMDDDSVEEIAEAIGRNPKVVEKEIKNYVMLPTARNRSVRWHLKNIPEWKHLKQSFTNDELNLIEDKYVKYVEQVKEDITATEETQVLNMITLEILMGRNLKGRMKLFDSIRQLEAMKEGIIDAVDGNWALISEEGRAQIMDIENQITASRNVESSRTSQYLELQKELNTLNTKLKTSRDQRVDKVLDPKHSFIAYVKDLLNRDKQEKESRFIQLYGMSVDKEEQRLSQAHQYLSGSYDNPILTTEILDKLDDREKMILMKENEENQENELSE